LVEGYKKGRSIGTQHKKQAVTRVSLVLSVSLGLVLYDDTYEKGITMTPHRRFTTIKHFSLALACAAAFALPGQSQAASASATSSGIVVVPIAIAKSADLSFGKFAAGLGGTLTVSTSGARTASGVTPLTSSTTTAAKFDVTGENSATYTITVPGTVTLTSGSDTMTFVPVNDLSGGNATSGTVTSGALDGTGKQSIFVGGVLTVGAAQAPGSYSGSLSLSVDYN
jgi:hypothetical protein